MALIEDGQTIALTGFGGSGHPEALSRGLGEFFAAHGRPRGLTVVHAAGQGNWSDKGMEHLAKDGLLLRIIGGHFATCPSIGRLVSEQRIEAYNLPQGVISQLYRDIAAGRPGCITHIGLETFIDPIHDAGRLNARSKATLVERVELGGRTWLWYKAFPIHVGFLRAWAADPLGNLVYDGEAVVTEPLAVAQAVHNSPGSLAGRGVVIAQVRHLLDKPAPPHSVRVPGVLVDRIVVAEPGLHPQTFGEDFNARYVAPLPSAGHHEPGLYGPPLPLDERRIIAARACEELRPGDIVNLGIGIPECIAKVAAERRMVERVTLTVEAGAIGGMPAGGLSFGASVHPHAIIEQPAQFDFYDGRGLDFAALGCAQVDESGNVNVSRFGPRLAGVGGFVNITQTARRLVFCGTFTAGGLELAVEDGRLRIVKEGRIRKFVSRVEQVSFSARRARQVRQEVLYVTERAVFRLGERGVELIELAPGIDLEGQVLALMDFRPRVNAVRPMPARAFEPAAAAREN